MRNLNDIEKTATILSLHPVDSIPTTSVESDRAFFYCWVFL